MLPRVPAGQTLFNIFIKDLEDGQSVPSASLLMIQNQAECKLERFKDEKSLRIQAATGTTK